MSPETFAHVSNLLIPTATVIYALAMVSHAFEWAMGRGVAAAAAAERAGRGTGALRAPSRHAGRRSTCCCRICLRLKAARRERMERPAGSGCC